MRKLFYIITIINILCSYSIAQPKWSKTGGGEHYDAGIAVDYDKNGNVYWLSFFQGPAVYEDSTYNNPNGYSLIKYDSLGNVIWQKNIEAYWLPGSGQGKMILDSAGNIYITAAFMDYLKIDDTTLYSAWQFDGDDFFICKINTDGALQWVNSALTILSDTSSRGCLKTSTYKIDREGNLYVMCHSLRSSPEVHELYKIASNGQVKRTTKIILPIVQFQPNYISWDIDEEGFIYWAEYDNKITKCDSNNNLIWTQYIDELDYVTDIDIDTNNNIYFLIDGYGDKKDILYKIDKNKNIIWEDVLNFYSRKISVSINDNIILYGISYMLPDSLKPIYIEKRDTDGKFMGYTSLASRIDGENPNGSVTDMKLSPNGTIYIAGDYGITNSSTSEFIFLKQDTLRNRGNLDGFVSVFHSNLLNPNNVLGIDEQYKKLDLVVYPNPFTAEFKIAGLKSKVNDIRVYDLLGNIMKIRHELINNEIVIYADELEKGFYLLEITDRNWSYNHKLVKH